jgi:hypothetical protein
MPSRVLLSAIGLVLRSRPAAGPGPRPAPKVRGWARTLFARAFLGATFVYGGGHWLIGTS